MPIVVSTKDCTALSDAELVEMADLCADRPPGFDIGFLSKEREAWVLITQAREGNKLRGYSFCTLERIGGPRRCWSGWPGRPDVTGRGGAQGDHGGPVPPGPAGLPRRGRPARGPACCRRRASGPSSGSRTSCPFPSHKSSGEERAWARRLSKRFGCESRLDDRTFVLKGDGSVAGGLDFFAPKVKIPEGVERHFGDFDADRGDRLVTFGWAMAEDLAGGKLGR